ncbi:aldehyde oxidase and xanthine dehydrogenase, a/b hammerhead domain protein [Mycobacterium xenopi 3993]|nr:aldehyde oxidase and xanthine dehydrogenase, a/b hammerhead domain protein [Mycobacterium xenopi 3993]
MFTAADLNPDVHEAWHAVAGRTFGHPRPAVAEGEAKFVGDPVAMVVADNRYIAEDAIELVEVDYEPLPPSPTSRGRKRRGGGSRGLPRQRRRGMSGAPPNEETLRAPLCRVRAHLAADLRAGAHRDARHRRRMVLGCRRTHHLGVHPDTARAACVRGAAAGIPAQRAGDHARHGAASVRKSSRCAKTCASCWPRAKYPRR